MTQHQKPFTLALCLGAAVLLASCAQTRSPAVAPTTVPSATGAPHGGHTTAGAPTASTAPSPSSAVSAGRRIEVSVTGKQVTPAPATVDLAVGESLTIALTSDHDDTLHAHGFEIKKDVKAGKQVEVTIKGNQTGTFEFELHKPQLRLFQVAVR